MPIPTQFPYMIMLGAGVAYSPGVLEFTTGFSWVHVAQSRLFIPPLISSNFSEFFGIFICYILTYFIICSSMNGLLNILGKTGLIK